MWFAGGLTVEAKFADHISFVSNGFVISISWSKAAKNPACGTKCGTASNAHSHKKVKSLIEF